MDSDVTTNLDSITDSDYTYDSILDDSVVDSFSVDSSADSTDTNTYLREIYRDVHFGLFFLVIVFAIFIIIIFGRFIYNLLR